MKLRFDSQVLGLLEGSIDMHIHSAPDIYMRILNDIELARQAQEMGMRAILVKNHFDGTAARARLATDETGFPVFGAITLNHTVGGLNAHAVDTLKSSWRTRATSRTCRKPSVKAWKAFPCWAGTAT
jgi:hypothetical protein